MDGEDADGYSELGDPVEDEQNVHREDQPPPLKQILGDYAFAHNEAFWRGSIWSLFAGCLLGILALGFMNLITFVPALWQGKEYYNHLDKVCYQCGQVWWIGITTAMGFFIGVLRAAFLSEAPAGFMKEALEQHVDGEQAPWVVLLTALSLIGGGSVGPEQGLGSLGGAIGTRWSNRSCMSMDWTRLGLSKLTRRERRMNTVTGMCGALGSLLPSPYLSVMLMFELGGNSIFQHYLESVVHASICATASFVVFQSLAGETALTVMALPMSAYDLQNLVSGPQVQPVYKVF
jgi:H+/Cl- antiporter ClcA